MAENDPYAGLKDLLPTEPAGPDPGRLRSLAGEIRRHVNVADPKSLYFGKPDLAAAAELQIKATLLRAGVPEVVPETPQQLAQRQYEESWPARETPPALAAMMEARVAALTALGEPHIARETAALQDRLGPEYARLVSLARQAGGTVAPAAFSDETLLRQLAAHGSYNLARNRAKPQGD